MIINGNGGYCLLAGLWLKLISIIFIAWTKWTLAMAVQWWQHYEYCRGYYYVIIIFIHRL